MWVIPIQTTTPTPEDVSCVQRQRLPSGTGAGIINSLPQLLLNVGGQVHDFTPPISCLPPEEPSAEKEGPCRMCYTEVGVAVAMAAYLQKWWQ